MHVCFIFEDGRVTLWTKDHGSPQQSRVRKRIVCGDCVQDVLSYFEGMHTSLSYLPYRPFGGCYRRVSPDPVYHPVACEYLRGPQRQSCHQCQLVAVHFDRTGGASKSVRSVARNSTCALTVYRSRSRNQISRLVEWYSWCGDTDVQPVDSNCHDHAPRHHVYNDRPDKHCGSGSSIFTITVMVPGLTESQAHEILDSVIQFEDGWGYERVRAMTNFRKDDGEARILYTCRRVSQDLSQQYQGSEGSFVMKVKVQVPSLLPGGQKEPLLGPSQQFLAEVKALQTFREKQRTSVPHLMSWKRITQGAESLFPGGYIAFTVMTLMPGENLLDLGFWSMSVDEQEVVRIAFITTLKDVWRDGFEPYDCALRNILWKRETKQCSIVDFEHYSQAKDPINMNENEELQKWGLVRRPPPTTWWAEWGLK